jgi:single-strand DNA-binding protein
VDEDSHANEVTLRGRLSSDPQARTLPSGAEVLTFRLVVRRDRSSPMTRGSKQVSDWIECAAWGTRARTRAAAWQSGDEVEIRGALRRRFYRTAAGSATRLEVEMLAGKRLRRSGTGAPQSGRAEAS